MVSGAFSALAGHTLTIVVALAARLPTLVVGVDSPTAATVGAVFTWPPVVEVEAAPR